MTIEDNKSIARHWLMDLWSKGDLNVADQVLATNYTRHDREFPLKGPEAYKRFIKAFRDVLLDMEFTEDHIVVEGEKVFVRWKARAYLKSGKQGEISGTDLLRIVDGKIVESWPLFDALGLMRQMGLLRFLFLVRKLKKSLAEH